MLGRLKQCFVGALSIMMLCFLLPATALAQPQNDEETGDAIQTVFVSEDFASSNEINTASASGEASSQDFPSSEDGVTPLATLMTISLAGSGQETDPYLISSVADLQDFCEMVNEDGASGLYFQLIADIDLGGESNPWTPIGTLTAMFAGTLDGANHEISGLFINQPKENYQGLFGFIGNTGTVKNLSVTGAVTGNQYAAGVVGRNLGSVINCSYRGTVTGAQSYNTYPGGIAGYNGGSIVGCNNFSTVTGNKYAGGIAGYNNSSIISSHNAGSINGQYLIGGVVGENWGEVLDCSNEGAISGSGENISGVAGYNGNKGSVVCCFNTGTVTAKGNYMYYASGVVGYNNGTIDRCYNSGTVSGIGTNRKYDSGIVGKLNGGSVTNCYNLGTVSGGDYSAGIAGESRGEVFNCYNAGTLTATSLPGGIVGKNNGTVESCYYLDNADQGIGTGDNTGTEAKTNSAFVSGEVAWLLQKNQETQVWGQQVGVENYPVLTSSTNQKVYRTVFTVGEQETIYGFMNGQAILPSNPSKSGYKFVGWSTEPNATNANFTAGSPVHSDMTVYAVFVEDSSSSYAANPENPNSHGELAQTGDNSSGQVWFSVMVLSLVLMLGAAFADRLSRKNSSKR